MNYQNQFTRTKLLTCLTTCYWPPVHKEGLVHQRHALTSTRVFCPMSGPAVFGFELILYWSQPCYKGTSIFRKAKSKVSCQMAVQYPPSCPPDLGMQLTFLLKLHIGHHTVARQHAAGFIVELQENTIGFTFIYKISRIYYKIYFIILNEYKFINLSSHAPNMF